MPNSPSDQNDGSRKKSIFVWGYNKTYIGLLKPVLEDVDCEIDFCKQAGVNQSVNFNPVKHSGLILLGGDGDSADTRKKTYRVQKNWLNAALEANTAILGICLGAQLLSIVCGGTLIFKCRKGKYLDKNLTEIRLTDIGTMDPLLSNYAENPKVLQFHSDAFSVPPGAVDLAQSTSCVFQHSEAFRIRKNVYGLQFHPEPDRKIIFKRNEAWLDRKTTQETIDQLESQGKALLRAWVRTAIDAS